MLERLYINNFRCLQNFELALGDSPSALLIGKNGVGKSTVLEVLCLLRSIAGGTNRVRDLVNQSVFAFGRTQSPIRFELGVKLQGKNYLYSLALELPDSFMELRVFEESLVCDNKEVFSREQAQVSLARDATNAQARFLIDWHLIALPVIQEETSSDPLAVFRRWLSQMLILSPHPRSMSGQSTGVTDVPEPNLGNFAEWFTGLLLRAPSQYQTIAQHAGLFMDDFLDVQNPLVAANARSLRVQYKDTSGSLDLEFGDLSDGEKCFIASAVAVAALAATPDGFCCWDEPDNYLALAEVEQFVRALRRSGKGGNQVLVTSHHSGAIRCFSDENTFILHRKSHIEPSTIRRLDSVNYDGDLIDSLVAGSISL